MTERTNPHSTFTLSDMPANPLQKPGYTLEFSEEFDGDTLNPENWLPQYLPQWSSRAKSTARYRLTGNSLQLLIEKDQQPWNPEFDGPLRVSSLQTGCYAGPLGSTIGQHRFNKGVTVKEEQEVKRLYTPQYGYFEVRLKAVPIPGYMAALWMIGFEETPDQSGEICICEIFGKGMTQHSAEVGYGIHPFGDPNLQDEFHVDTLPIDASSYHIYAVDWTPTHVDFYVDNIKIRTIQQSPKYPMQFMLNIYEIPSHLNEQSRPELWPKVMEVDYVRGYRKNGL
ncbi:glycoside hydrolase family 16 protein [Deinococcus cellulosilyticus]|uniref:GH16 domain-containing protein n=1 Tax=Deinococcus cellulosilyticus (strain DSM 18568 / NBRC 106333 / KACC 11606 / 5516J-15) TaxID=1223518 RepID=A0A511N1W5_DEIC1|nr:glycoside hydrolase family 16 protein [Deinococcus cellulosilyticus]GEM46855.1 hypothetical protein DC3_24900 [Deinococcus cellulosilyticus NBRC 106333 = KACC 11606]